MDPCDMRVGGYPTHRGGARKARATRRECLSIAANVVRCYCRHMKRIDVLLCSITLLLPAPCLAASGNDLLDDAGMMSVTLTADENAAKQDAVDEALESADDLLPVAGHSSSASLPSDVLTIVVDGARIALKDVPLTAWFAQYIETVADAGIVSGYRDSAGRPLGMFGPADSVTVEQLAKMAVVAKSINTETCGDTANATARGRWSEFYVACAEQHAWSVYSDATVTVTRPATRAEVVATVLQAFGVEPAAATGKTFTDVNASTHFSAFVERAAADGIVSGYADASGKPTGKFGPSDRVNRAEIAKIFTLALSRYSR